MAVEPERRDSATEALSWLAHPVSVLGLALLLVNDHVLKSAWPSPVTGKLSDLAGLLVAPPLLAAIAALLLPRVPGRALVGFALVLTGSGFTLVKSTQLGAAAASAAWSTLAGPSVIRYDPTDLLALPAIGAAWWAWRRSRARPVANRSARLVRRALLVPVALAATLATSAPKYPETVWVGEVDGRVVIGERDAYYGPDSEVAYLASSDRGVTFDPAATVAEPAQPRPQPQDCLGATCYRIVPGELHVQRSDDAGQTWTTAWQVSGLQYRDLAARYVGLRDGTGQLSSLAVLVRPAPGGHVVLVANGRDGLLRRAVTGRWERLGTFTGWTPDPPPLTRARDFHIRAATTGVAAFLLVLLAGLGALLARAGGGPAGRWLIAGSVTVLAFTVDLGLMVSQGAIPGWLVALALAVNAAGVAGLGDATARLARSRAIWWPALALPITIALASAFLASWLARSTSEDVDMIIIRFPVRVSALAGACLLGASAAAICAITSGSRRRRPPRTAA